MWFLAFSHSSFSDSSSSDFASSECVSLLHSHELRVDSLFTGDDCKIPWETEWAKQCEFSVIGMIVSYVVCFRLLRCWRRYRCRCRFIVIFAVLCFRIWRWFLSRETHQSWWVWSQSQNSKCDVCCLTVCRSHSSSLWFSMSLYNDSSFPIVPQLTKWSLSSMFSCFAFCSCFFVNACPIDNMSFMFSSVFVCLLVPANDSFWTIQSFSQFLYRCALHLKPWMYAKMAHGRRDGSAVCFAPYPELCCLNLLTKLAHEPM